ncbi:putative MFS family arabinose efflux permease [Herbihabitans rhizosphaerae]|uniref:Multidrug efflux pump Tap n=1 Tax=Herbihabitans rhizosphaerae TaxID=1872711 RepID=A0A4Q7L5R0_9PSEU|nr:MFS transporter [Herbihabitans rhizosphaerae]RZS44667.1 putative MFS family arabinose efflux permease [Herbihabitans rhizosphaerae]
MARTVPVAGLLGAAGLSITGNTIVQIAIPWLVMERTGSPALAGLIAAASLLPMAVSALLGGALIDRWGRRRLSIGADLLSAAAVAAVPLLDRAVGLTAGLIALLVALGAVFDGPGMAARESLRPDVAQHSRVPLERVNAWGEAVDGFGGVAAPGLAGVLIATVGAANTLWATVAMFLAAAVLTATTIPAQVRDDSVHEPYGRAVVEGLRFVLRKAELRATAITLMMLVLFVAPLTTVLTIELQRAGRPGDLGLIAAMFAVGGIAGAVGYGFVAPRLRRRPVLWWALALTGVGLAAFALLDGTLGRAVLAAAVGIGAAPVNPITAVIMQEKTPERLRGRVIGTVTSLALLAAPLGAAFAGALVDGVGAAVTYALIGAGCLVSAGYAAIAPGLRHIEVRAQEESIEEGSCPLSRTP